MSKRRPGYGHRERDNYPTPWAAVLPLLSHLKPSTRFIEPCAGEGWLVGHLKRAGHICAGAFDLPGHDARTTRYDLKAVDAFITNPPWQTRPSNILHPIIINLSDQAPAWMLIYSDWLCTSQATPLLPRLKAIAVIGRQKWIAGSESAGFDNCCWCLFGRPRADGPSRSVREMDAGTSDDLHRPLPIGWRLKISLPCASIAAARGKDSTARARTRLAERNAAIRDRIHRPSALWLFLVVYV